MLARASDDPVGFVEVLPRPAAIDEFQRAGRGFLLAVKQAADQDRTRGQLLLTGSTNYLADRGLSGTLGGRETFPDLLFEPASWSRKTEAFPRADLIQTLLEGDSPEIVTEGLSGRQHRNWFESYVHDVVARRGTPSYR
ncbi:hypothetical protein [Amycolatopsis sp. NPDC004079]|uniref:hypothetical protein n=1 Tax=Amycolatopsis sp. NPDC004079 TaxID=3154549 RepID=UPI0033AD03C4